MDPEATTDPLPTPSARNFDTSVVAAIAPEVTASSAPAPSNLLKRMASDDGMSELIHKAKASRYTAPSESSPSSEKADEKSSWEEEVAAEVTCAICAELYIDPVMVIPCHHIFCGACASRWFSQAPTCPSCRSRATDTSPAITAANVVESIYKGLPSKMRPEDEIKELKEIYPPGSSIRIHHSYEYSSEEEEELEEVNDISVWEPCLCCVAGNPHNYVCPNPIVADSSGNYPRVDDDVTTFRGHMRCTHCEITLPTGLVPIVCEFCEGVSCVDILPESSCTTRPYVRPLQQQSFKASSARESLSMNPIEREKLADYMSGNDLDWERVGDLVREFTIPTLGRDPQTDCCQSCASGFFERNIMKWWIRYKEEVGFVDARTTCWYGWECRTQHNNPLGDQSHARRLCHACEPTPSDQRTNTAPPRRPATPAPAPAPAGGDGE